MNANAATKPLQENGMQRTIRRNRRKLNAKTVTYSSQQTTTERDIKRNAKVKIHQMLPRMTKVRVCNINPLMLILLVRNKSL